MTSTWLQARIAENPNSSISSALTMWVGNSGYPIAAGRASEFLFHPTQKLEHEKDGSLLVRFKACGLLEMCWFLYQWGDSVEVLQPSELREMVHPYRRPFSAFP